MRVNPIRVLATAAVFAVSTLLLACPLGRLHVLIPDFETSRVEGLQMYRVDDGTGMLVAAGSLRFVGIEENAFGGELMRYRQVSADGAPVFGTVLADVVRDPQQPASIELEMIFLNELPAGWFRVATYNAAGTSRPSSTQTYIQAERS